eukprot:3155221-Pleurochrysis_carterae.AAC.1
MPKSVRRLSAHGAPSQPGGSEGGGGGGGGGGGSVGGGGGAVSLCSAARFSSASRASTAGTQYSTCSADARESAPPLADREAHDTASGGSPLLGPQLPMLS